MVKKNIPAPIAIIGAGIAGLCVSFYLAKNKIPHIIIEKGEVANTWIKERWENFHLVNPNWAIKIPEYGFGSEYFPSKNPDGFLNKNQTIDYIKSFAKYIGSEIFTNENVNSISKENSHYRIVTNKRTIKANTVIIASGAFGDSYIPRINSELNKNILQIHSSEYKSVDKLPQGGVLVVGAGQSGAQIAEELLENGKETWLSVSKCGRRPRNYRGKDSSWWNYKMGSFDKTVDDVPFKQRWGCSPHTSGSRGGHDINLLNLAEQGLRLCGTVKKCTSNKIIFNDNLYQNLIFSDQHAINWAQKVDNYIVKNNLKMPPEKINEDTRISNYTKNNITDISALENISSIIWATGFRYDFKWIKLDITNKFGHPVQRRGITKYNGLYFMGLQWMHSSKSAQFVGVAEDAKFIVDDILSKNIIKEHV